MIAELWGLLLVAALGIFAVTKWSLKKYKKDLRKLFKKRHGKDSKL